MDIISQLALGNNDFRKKYLIKDLIGKSVKILFVLESPHNDELIHKYPVAGDTGSEISKYLLTDIDEQPIGKYILDNIDSSKFGIINCCQIPMQKASYCSNIENKDLFESFKTIRNTKEDVSKRQNQYTQFIDDVIGQDLKCRLSFILNSKDIHLIIPCGRMARYFIKKCEIDSKIEIEQNIPHPSRNNWHKEKSRIQKLKIKIEKL